MAPLWCRGPRHGAKFSLDSLARRFSCTPSVQFFFFKKVRRERPAPVQPLWLQKFVDSTESPPRLYAWAPANLPSGDGEKSGASRIRPPRKREDGDQSAGDEEERRRIYILGVGNIGRLYASCLARSANPPPITLVLHRRELLEQWVSKPGIEIARQCQGGGDEVVTRTEDYDVEYWTEQAPTDGGPVAEPAGGRIIRNLIVATKAADALPQVDRLRRYLDHTSTVAFTQNGMCNLWPPFGETYVRAKFPKDNDNDNDTGPSWLACVTTHGVTSQGPFRSLHASPASVLVGLVRSSSDSGSGSSSDQGAESASHRYLTDQIVNAPDLAATEAPSRKDLWIAQAEKLVVNSVINPLTAVLRVKNGELFAAAAEHRDDPDADPDARGLALLIDQLIGEAALIMVLTIQHTPLVADLCAAESSNNDRSASVANQKRRLEIRDELRERFMPERLQVMVREVGARVAENTSSMLQDVRAGKGTEIGELNGWLVDAGRALPVPLELKLHQRLMRLVTEGRGMEVRELVRALKV
ncbi:6-phosphogluconate dehydrogenase C-terminal domain-like protein [Xylariomycetidae sp. FL2044]|nr:6-phosphogluconate dehydrogenase C-terminal domain-like protein [Xylariomycetidae sp. FL2044]